MYSLIQVFSGFWALAENLDCSVGALSRMTSGEDMEEMDDATQQAGLLLGESIVFYRVIQSYMYRFLLGYL